MPILKRWVALFKRIGRPSASGTAGPELAPQIASSFASYTLSGTTPPTANASGIHFAAASNLAGAFTSVALVNDAIYDINFTVANRSSGTVRVIVYGSTTGHAGVTPSQNANGVYYFRVATNAGGTAINRILMQATTANTTLDVTAISVKRIT